MSSGSDNDSHEIYEYPNCEEEDCYCLNHWPNRFGGDEHKVVDNKNFGEFTIRCDVAINNGKFPKCTLCSRYCLGDCLEINEGEITVCVRCCNGDEGGLREFLQQNTEKDFLFISNTFFDSSVDSPDDIVVKDQDGEHTFHTKFYKEEIVLDGSQKCLIALSFLLKNYPKRFAPLKESLTTDFFQFKKDFVAKKSAQREQKWHEIKNKAKRIVRDYFPTATDQEIDKVVTTKRQRRLNEIPEPGNILKFVEWLKKD